MESMELAFVSALHRLPPKGRAVLILRAVLECSAQETAELLGMTPAAVNSALQRARSTIRSQQAEHSQQEVVRELGDRRLRALVARYTRAMEAGDVAAVLELLDADATWTMPPMATWYRGTTAIEAFLRDFALQERWRHLVTSANGQPAVGCYRWDPDAGAYLAYVLDVLTIRGDRIAAVNAFIDAAAVTMCGLPDRLEEE
jgi:RNA polymerase sigma-70 factor (ECF subfamily)